MIYKEGPKNMETPRSTFWRYLGLTHKIIGCQQTKALSLVRSLRSASHNKVIPLWKVADYTQAFFVGKVSQFNTYSALLSQYIHKQFMKCKKNQKNNIFSRQVMFWEGGLQKCRWIEFLKICFQLGINLAKNICLFLRTQLPLSLRSAPLEKRWEKLHS